MIRVYILPVETINSTEVVAGSELIHDALLECTIDPHVRKLTMDTTQEEHDSLVAVAGDTYPATQEEIDRYNAQVSIYEPDPDTIRACEILATSPDVITQPEIWELLRIIGRRLGYHFD